MLHDQGWTKWNSPFRISNVIKKDTGAGGSCQFSSISEALYPIYDLSVAAVRSAAAQGVLSMEKSAFDAAMIAYVIDKKERRLQGGWNPLTVKTPRDLANQILLANEPGNGGYFWGDHTTLAALARHLKIDIYVLEETNKHEGAVVKITPLGVLPSKHAILLWFSRSGMHYQVVGVQHINGKQTIFTHDEIPAELHKYVEDKTISKKPKVAPAVPAISHTLQKVSKPSVSVSIVKPVYAVPIKSQNRTKKRHPQQRSVTKFIPLLHNLCNPFL